jgi:hypothetical protein
MKTRPVGAELFYADGQRERDRRYEGNSGFFVIFQTRLKTAHEFIFKIE